MCPRASTAANSCIGRPTAKLYLIEKPNEYRGLALDQRPVILKIRGTAEWSERVDGDLLIILDQFEEYFLYHSQEDGGGTFAIEFPRAVNSPDLRVKFLVSIRADSLAKLDHFKGRIPNLFDNYLRFEHFDREVARMAIENPIERYNRLQVTLDWPIRSCIVRTNAASPA